MVTSCAAWGCTNRLLSKRSKDKEDKKGDLTFHRFPTTKPVLLAKWVRAVRRENFLPTQYHRLCSKHFLSTDFSDRNCRRMLKKNAVPSVFSFPQDLQESEEPCTQEVIDKEPTPTKRKSKRLLRDDHSEESCSQEVIDQEPTPTKRKSKKLLRYDHSEEPCKQEVIDQEPTPTKRKSKKLLQDDHNEESCSQVVIDQEPTPTRRKSKSLLQDDHSCCAGEETRQQDEEKRRQNMIADEEKERQNVIAEEKKTQNMIKSIITLKRDKRLLYRKLRRRQSKMKRLKDIVAELEDESPVESRAYEILEDVCDGMSLSLYRHLLINKGVHKNASRYTETIKKFSVTLHCLSPKAYDYLRPIFGLPSTDTLRVWTGHSVSASVIPSFTPVEGASSFPA